MPQKPKPRLNKATLGAVGHLPGAVGNPRECVFCGLPFMPRLNGRRQRFCHGGKCRRAFDKAAREIAIAVLRRRRKTPNPRSPEELADVAWRVAVGALRRHAAAQRRLVDLQAMPELSEDQRHVPFSNLMDAEGMSR
jgi:hypothetical protein